MTGCLLRIQRDTEEDYVMVGTENEGTQLQAKKLQGLPATIRGNFEEAKKNSFL